MHVQETLEVDLNGLYVVFICTSFLIEVEFIYNNHSNSCRLLRALPFLANRPPEACFLPSNSITWLSIYINHMATQRDVSHPTDTSLWLANPFTSHQSTPVDSKHIVSDLLSHEVDPMHSEITNVVMCGLDRHELTHVIHHKRNLKFGRAFNT